MRILKFGGSSVSTPERINHVIQIINQKYRENPSLAVVVSAFGGITDALINMSHQAAKGDVAYEKSFRQIKDRHYAMAEALVPQAQLSHVAEHLNLLFDELKDMLHGLSLLKEITARSLDSIMSLGERWSAYIISEALKPYLGSATYLDARKVIKTDRNFGSALVDYERTNAAILHHFSHSHEMPIITGFIGSSSTGETTTLGRGGSDYTAAIFGAALKAEKIEIWTDVDGVMTADPRKVPQATTIPRLSFKEVLEMSYFGAKVIHPPTIIPAYQHDIPIWIKNTFNPSFTGTLITNQSLKDTDSPICGLSSIDRVSLIRLEGSGMVGICGTAARLFAALARKEINVILISQGSSEHSICLAISPQSVEGALEAVNHEFKLEIKNGLIDPPVAENGMSIIAAVGERMRHFPGTAGRLFSALGKNGINIAAIVQGSSEYNISMVIKSQDENKALNVIHDEFFLSGTAKVHLFLIGTGLIGRTLLALMNKHGKELKDEQAMEIVVAGLANSSKMLFNAHGLSLNDWEEQLSRGEKMEIEAYAARVKEMGLSNAIFVDCTASEEIANLYPVFLSSNISIVTPNKKANSSHYSDYQFLKRLCKEKKVKFLYEANVGAGLPIIRTIYDLQRSGDRIIKFEAILSGTLSYIFNTFSASCTFSQAVQGAQAKGYTEPDPREDLTGQDIKRKLLILARECGCPLEMEEIVMEPLLPQEYFDTCSVPEFYQKLVAYDEKMARQIEANKRLRYIARFENGKGTISLQSVSESHPFYDLSGSDNIIALTTERYQDTPLVIKGKGAGAEVTAGEVFADIIRIGAKS